LKYPQIEIREGLEELKAIFWGGGGGKRGKWVFLKKTKKQEREKRGRVGGFF